GYAAGVVGECDGAGEPGSAGPPLDDYLIRIEQQGAGAATGRAQIYAAAIVQMACARYFRKAAIAAKLAPARGNLPKELRLLIGPQNHPPAVAVPPAVRADARRAIDEERARVRNRALALEVAAQPDQPAAGITARIHRRLAQLHFARGDRDRAADAAGRDGERRRRDDRAGDAARDRY